MKAFISYAHRDEQFVKRLHAHLATLKREGSITVWYDREILAGDAFNTEIFAELETSDLFLAMVSPDFLNSDYCYDKEMKAALKMHETGKMRVLPVILEPCDWLGTPLGKLKAVPTDGKPIAEWDNQNTAFLDVVNELRRIVSQRQSVNDTSTKEGMVKALKPTPANPATNNRYRIKKTFDEIDHRDFRESAYKEIRGYFEFSVAEINAVEGIKARFSDMSMLSFTCTVKNTTHDRGTSYITVHAGQGMIGMGDIYYSFSENASANTANGGFHIEADDHELFLKTWDMMSLRTKEKITAQQAAKSLWEELLRQSGISYA